MKKFEFDKNLGWKFVDLTDSTLLKLTSSSPMTRLPSRRVTAQEAHGRRMGIEIYRDIHVLKQVSLALLR